MGIFDAIGNVFATGLTNQSNQKIADKTNKFNADQAAINREFQSQEAQIARDWQEEQYNKYSSHSTGLRI